MDPEEHFIVLNDIDIFISWRHCYLCHSKHGLRHSETLEILSPFAQHLISRLPSRNLTELLCYCSISC